jgi:RNA recognition motif-containing protein
MNIYVSNLGTKITEESIRAIFATYGHVQSYRLIYEPPLGGQLNFAFIDMPDYREATEAISRLNGCIVNGQEIIVKEYKTA